MVSDMTRQTATALCQALPDADLSQPFGDGHDVWKIGGKIFAALPNGANGIALKCGDVQTALHLEDMFGWPKAPYFHRSWVLVPLDTDVDELRFRIETSYTLIRKTLTKKAQGGLGPWPKA